METEKEKTESTCECKTGYHHHPAKLVICLIIGLFILGGFFCLGRMSARHEFGGRQNVNKGSINIDAGRFDNHGMMGGRGIRGGYDRGITGSITAINVNKITVKNSTGTEYTVDIADTTSLSTDTAVAKQADLKVGQNVIVSGSTNSAGEITATNVRIQS